MDSLVNVDNLKLIVRRYGTAIKLTGSLILAFLLYTFIDIKLALIIIIVLLAVLVGLVMRIYQDITTSVGKFDDDEYYYYDEEDDDEEGSVEYSELSEDDVTEDERKPLKRKEK